jgi:hypothetical protein
MNNASEAKEAAAPAPDPLDELETFVEGQIKSVEESRDAYLRHAERCNQVAQGLRDSLKALRETRGMLAPKAPD